jgi:TRAP transporter TAXI family solute receptor
MIGNTRRILGRITLAAILAIGTFCGGPVLAQNSAPVALDLGSTFIGSTWYQYAAAMAPLMQATLPAGSNVTVRPYAGASGNIDLIANNRKIQLGLTFSATAHVAANEGGNKAALTKENLRALFGGLDENFIAVMATAKSGITSLADIKRKKMKVRIVSLPHGGLAYDVTRRILALYGITEHDIEAWGGSWDKVNVETAGNAMADGRADLWINPAALGHPKIMELTQSTKIKFLDLAPDVITRLEEAGYSSAVLPANAFKGQTQPEHTVAATTLVIVNASMPDSLAYTLTKAVVGNASALGARNKGLAHFTAANAWQPTATGGIPLHPGAEKYFRESGLIK